ncbi:hypothetical protein [Rhabdothermincola sp.]|uniref:hypothetical protein n=1 Tax=Rhabdothermincola sp. TaxID=2820405 RepID=UPI002FE41B3C
MSRTFLRRLSCAAIVVAAITATALPASANSVITATSVSLNSAANCSVAHLDIGMEAGTVTHEAGFVTGIDGLLDSFIQSSSFSGFSGTFSTYGMPMPDQPDRTIIGSYAWIGTNPPNAANTAEWFVLYLCDPAGNNEVLDTCYGDYGTCPQTALDGLRRLMSVDVDDETPEPGQTITVHVARCMYPVGVTRLLQGDLVLDSYTVTDGETSQVQAREFLVELTVPADVPPGSSLSVVVDCGYEDGPIVSGKRSLQVAGESVTTTTSTPASPTTTAASRAVTATPTFTG